MSAHKAQRSKKRDGSKDPTLKISTFRLGDQHRFALDKYALALGQSMSPPKVVSKTLAIQHMILTSPLPAR